MTLLPKQQAPDLKIELIDGGTWTLADQKPENFTMLVFYRGLHCPVCKSYLETMQKMKAKYEAIGVELIAISMDTEKRAAISREEWDANDIKIGYKLSEAKAREFNLYLSQGIKKGEPDLFSEPGLFLIRPNQELYFVTLNSQPFGRPHLGSFVKSIEWIIENNYPARGEF